MNHVVRLLSVIILIGFASLVATSCVPAATAGGQPAAHTEAMEHVTVVASDLEWNPVSSLPPGATAAMIEGDLSSPVPFTFRLKFPANYEIPAHTHPTTERVTVLSGTLYLATGDDLTREAAQALPSGSVTVMPPGMKMWGYTGAEEVVIQLNGIGPWGLNYLNPDEDPRNN